MKLDIVSGHRLFLNGIQYKFRERRHNLLDWVSDETRDLVTLSDLELVEFISEGLAILQEPGVRYDSETQLEIAGRPDRNDGSHSKPGRKTRVDTANRLTGKDRLAYVKEAITEGLHLQKNKEAMTNLASRVAKERGDKVEPSFRTMENWLKRSASSPTAKRLSSLHHLKGNRNRRYCNEVIEIIDEVIAQKFLIPEPVPKYELKNFALAEIRRRNANRTTDHLPEIGDKIIRNQIAKLKMHEILKAQKGATIAYSKEGLAYEMPDPTRPLERVEIDHTVFDLIVVDPENGLPIGRPTLAVAIDRCSRMPFGIHLSFDPPSLQTVMECLKNGVLAKTYVERKKSAPEHPWNIKNDWPVAGLPHSLVVDLARENVSEDLRNFAFKIGINEVHFMPGRSPWFKGAIERFIGTANRKVAHTTPGTTFSNTLTKAEYASTDRAIVTLDQLQEAMHKWIIDIYQFTPHGGTRRAPRKLWDQITEKNRVRTITDRREIDAVIGRSGRSSMLRTGVKFKHLTYQSAEYGNFRDSEECRAMKGADGKIAFLYDATDLSEIRIVRKNGDVLHVPISRKWEKYAKGLSIWQHNCINAYLNAENKSALTEKNFIEAKDELFNQMRNFRPGSTAKKRGQRSTAKGERFSGNHRRAFAGESTDVHVHSWSEPTVFAAVTPDPELTTPDKTQKMNIKSLKSSQNPYTPSNFKFNIAEADLDEPDPYANMGSKNA